MRAINMSATGASVAQKGAGSGGGGAGAGPSAGTPCRRSRSASDGTCRGSAGPGGQQWRSISFRRSRQYRRQATEAGQTGGRQRRAARCLAVRRLYVRCRRRQGLYDLGIPTAEAEAFYRQYYTSLPQRTTAAPAAPAVFIRCVAGRVALCGGRSLASLQPSSPPLAKTLPL